MTPVVTTCFQVRGPGLFSRDAMEGEWGQGEEMERMESPEGQLLSTLNCSLPPPQLRREALVLHQLGKAIGFTKEL